MQVTKDKVVTIEYTLTPPFSKGGLNRERIPLFEQGASNFTRVVYPDPCHPGQSAHNITGTEHRQALIIGLQGSEQLVGCDLAALVVIRGYEPIPSHLDALVHALVKADESLS